MAYADEVMADSPYLYWRLNDTGATAADQSGNGRTGTYSGSPTMSQSGLISDGTSVLFDATNDYCLSAATVNISTATVEIWFDYNGTPPGSPRYAYICGFNNGYDGGVGDKLLLINASGRPVFEVYDGSTREATGGDVLSAGVYHLVGVIDDADNTAYIYVNGVLKGETTAASSYTGYGVPNIMVGGKSTSFGMSPSNPEAIAGRRDEFAVYDAALSDTRILAHYQAGTATTIQLSSLLTSG